MRAPAHQNKKCLQGIEKLTCNRIVATLNGLADDLQHLGEEGLEVDLLNRESPFIRRRAGARTISSLSSTSRYCARIPNILREVSTKQRRMKTMHEPDGQDTHFGVLGVDQQLVEETVELGNQVALDGVYIDGIQDGVEEEGTCDPTQYDVGY